MRLTLRENKYVELYKGSEVDEILESLCKLSKLELYNNVLTSGEIVRILGKSYKYVRSRLKVLSGYKSTEGEDAYYLAVLEVLLKDIEAREHHFTARQLTTMWGIDSAKLSKYLNKEVFEPSYVDILGVSYFDMADIKYLKLDMEMRDRLYPVFMVSKLSGVSARCIERMLAIGTLVADWVSLNKRAYLNPSVVDRLKEDKGLRDSLSNVTDVSKITGIHRRHIERMIDVGDVVMDYIALTGRCYFKPETIRVIEVEYRQGQIATVC